MSDLTSSLLGSRKLDFFKVSHTYCHECGRVTKVERNYQGHYFCAECHQITSFWVMNGYPQTWKHTEKLNDPSELIDIPFRYMEEN